MTTVTRKPAARERQFLRRLRARQEELGDVADWSFADACAWLGLDTRRTWGEDLRGSLDAFEGRLDACAGALGERKARPCLRAFRQVWAKFHRHLTLLLRRRVKGDGHE